MKQTSDKPLRRHVVGMVSQLLFMLIVALCSLHTFAAEVALMIVDMQPYFAENGFPGAISDAANAQKNLLVLDRQVELINLAKAQQMPIIVVEYVHEYKDLGSTHPRITEAIGDYPLKQVFVKPYDGLFDLIDPSHTSYLAEKGIKGFVIVGANGGYCVQSTIIGALQEGYKVWTDSQAIIDYNYREFKHPFSYSPRDSRWKGLNQLSRIESLDDICSTGFSS